MSVAAKAWFDQAPVSPREFAMLPVADAALVVWNYLSWHGMLQPILEHVEQMRQAEVEAVITGITRDLNSLPTERRPA